MQQLESLRRQHHALLPQYLLRLPPNQLMASEEGQRFLVEQILRDAAISPYTAERGYERTFWRRIVSELEKGVEEMQNEDDACDIEVDEAFYEHLASVMVSDTASDLPPQSYRSFIYDHPDWTRIAGQCRVTLLEEQVAIQAGTTGLRTWTASLHLAHHILHSPRILEGDADALPRIIELGAGTGFLSILLSQLGADVIATDLDGSGDDERQTPLRRLAGNVALNETKKPVRVEALDWMDAERPMDDRPSIWKELADEVSARTVIGADIIYDPSLVPPLVTTIRELLSHDNVGIISATVRNPATLALFVDTCHERGLRVEVLDLEPMSTTDPTFWDSALDAGSEVRIMRITKSS